MSEFDRIAKKMMEEKLAAGTKIKLDIDILGFKKRKIYTIEHFDYDGWKIQFAGVSGVYNAGAFIHYVKFVD